MESLIKIINFIINTTHNFENSNLQTAINETNEGDILNLSKDANISYAVTVSDIKVTLDLNGFNLKNTKTITNKTELGITNSNTEKQSMLYSSISVTLLNNTDSRILDIKNAEIGGYATKINASGYTTKITIKQLILNLLL
jgi:hypothetical protein